MKVFTIFVFLIFSILLVSSSANKTSQAQDSKKVPETIIIAKESKLGRVTFHHLDHIMKNYSVDGTKQLACVDCHHTAQPAAEAEKHPPNKTVWPADRTTTLTAELFDKDPAAPPVNLCTDCHARANTKPKLLPEIPKLKFEGSEAPTVLKNEKALHRNCAGCHDAVVKARTGLAPPPPTSKKCVACHKKTASRT